MAVLRHIGVIHGDSLDTMEYIQNPEKILSNEEIKFFLPYILQGDVSPVATLGYHGCSSIRELAIEQFRFSEALYRQFHPKWIPQESLVTTEQYLRCHFPGLFRSLMEANLPDDERTLAMREALPKALRERLREDDTFSVCKNEIHAEHLVLSFHPQDAPTAAQARAVLDEFMAHPLFHDFYVLASLHNNTEAMHFHILVSNHSKDGRKKFCWKRKREAELRRHLDRCCVNHSLSIIDAFCVRGDPEHAAWIDRLKEEGYPVWPERATSYAQGGRSNQQCWLAAVNASDKRRGIFDPYHELSAEETAIVETMSQTGYFGFLPGLSGLFRRYQSLLEDARILADREEAQLKRKKLREEELRRQYYFVQRRTYDPDAHRMHQRSTVELMMALLILVVTNNSDFLEEHQERGEYEMYLGPPDRWSESLYEMDVYCNKYSIREPWELKDRQKDLQREIGRSKQRIAHYQSFLTRNESLYAATKTYYAAAEGSAEQEAAQDLLASAGLTTVLQYDRLNASCFQAEQNLAQEEAYLKNTQFALKEAYKVDHTWVALQHHARATTEESRRVGEAFLELYAKSLRKPEPAPSLSEQMMSAAARRQVQLERKAAKIRRSRSR